MSPEATASASPAPAPSKDPKSNIASTVNDEVYIADGDYVKDIEVNDLRNRYTLTKSSTQKTVNKSFVLFNDRVSICH